MNINEIFGHKSFLNFYRFYNNLLREYVQTALYSRLHIIAF